MDYIQFILCVAVLQVSSRCQHLLMVGGDEPQLHVHVASSLLCSDELQQVFMSHPVQVEDVVLVLPRLLVLNTKHTEVRGHDCLNTVRVQRLDRTQKLVLKWTTG